MQNDIISYLSGISNAIYATICLLCGLQLCLGIFSQGRHANTVLSRILGTCMLVMFFSAVCYLLSEVLELDFFYRIGTSIDIFLFTGYAMMGYALYTNNEPSKARFIVLASPFVLCAILNMCFPACLEIPFFAAAAVLFTYFIYFGIALQRRERVLDDLYADPESHSLRWIWTAIGLCVGWWIVSGLFQLFEGLKPWYLCASFTYMTVLFLFLFAKVSNYKQPVSLKTQQEIENDNERKAPNDNGNINRLKELMEAEQLYLDPDLTVEKVAKRMGTNAKSLSALLHHNMQTSFSQMVNEYRVEKAKYLLEHTDTKVEFIGEGCGFNSRQSFHRVFAKITGKTPAEWREKS